MALAIPITLAMTFGISYMLGIDLQQVSIASLIIALGLLVDVPVVAGDGIKRGLAEGLPRRIAAWLGPTKLATAIFYATLTNIIAYLPFLMLHGNTGEFLKSLPIVMTAALFCALVVAMTFHPTPWVLHSKATGQERAHVWKKSASVAFMDSITASWAGRFNIDGPFCSLLRFSC